jgi:cobalt-zinc-cadmium efflux system outer membrane protein
MRPMWECATIVFQTYLGILAVFTLILASSAPGRAQPDWPPEPGVTSVPVTPAQVTPLEWPLSARHHITTPFAETRKLDLNTLFPELQILQKISFRDFVRQVEESNLDLAAQRYNVPIAQMRVLAAHLYPDPLVQGFYGLDISHQHQPATYAASVSQTVLLGGKIGARTEVAKAGLALTSAQLQEYLRNLKVQAAQTYVDGIADMLKLRRDLKGLQRSKELIGLIQGEVDRGKASQIDLLRSRVSALQARDDLINAQSHLQQTLVKMSILLGRNANQEMFRPTGNLDIPPRDFRLDALLANAMVSRNSIVAARAAVEVARAQYHLVEVNRVPDVTVGVSYNHFTQATNPIDPSPAWNALALQLSMPIPLSNLNQGHLQEAHFEQLQAEEALQAVQLKVESDVRGAFERYDLAVDTVAQYAKELVGDANQVYKAKLYSLEKGQTTLLDVLDAHRTINHIYIDYYDALAEQAKSLIALEHAAGIWDVNF